MKQINIFPSCNESTVTLKKFLLFIVLFSPFIGGAQNYQCLQPGVKRYFTNSVSYLRGMRIDRVDTIGTETIFYPFHTLRETDTPAAHGSWLGSKVTMLADRTFLFDNIWNDTTIIKTQANTGDSWTFYDDTTTKYYLATVLSVDTMTVLGVSDSVKTIRINAFNSGVADTMDPVNNFEIKLSKNHGFVQVFDLYTFPYHFSFGADYFYRSAQSQIFNLVSYHNPTLLEIYNFSAGDLFERKTHTSIDWAYAIANPINIDYEGVVIDSVVEKSSPDAYHVRYALQHKGYQNELYYNPTTLSATYHPTYNYIDTMSFDTTSLFPLTMPEETPDMTLYYYTPSDAHSCSGNAVYTKGLFEQTVAYPPGLVGSSQACVSQVTYIPGYGWTNTMSFLCAQDPPVEWVYNDQVYSVRSGDTCGSYISLGVPETKIPINSIEVYPSPATTTLNITSTSGITNIAICNLLGQAIINRDYKSKNVTVDVSSLSEGIYLVKINDSEVRRFLKR